VEPARVVVDGDRPGARFTFEIDADWLPSGGRVLDLAGAHPWVIDLRG
jgi:hypothetical protein